MAKENEHILVVESDPDVSDLIARQTLTPMGYRVKVAETVSEAIQQAMIFSPDLVITSLHLPDLTGKDLLVALSSQGLEIPVILTAEKDAEADVIQALRLGASDHLTRPVREAELVSAVERALKQIRSRRERESLAQQLKQSNQQLERRVRELTTIFAIGKAVTSITDQGALFDRIVEGALYVTEADRGWLLIREEDGQGFVLRAHRHLPKSLEMRLNQSWDDGISSLVALSGEPLLIHGDPLKRFKIASLGQAALVVPVKIKKEIIGLLVVVRKAPKPFSNSNQAMLEAVADYATISLVNARLFHAIEDRAHSLQRAMEQARQSEKSKDELIQRFSEELRRPLVAAKGYVEMLSAGQLGDLSEEQRRSILVAEDNLDRLSGVIDRMSAHDRAAAPEEMAPTSLNELARQAINRFQRTAQRAGLVLMAEMPSDEVYAYADRDQVARVFDGLLTNAIKFCPKGGQVTVRIARTEENLAHVTVKDTGIGIQQNNVNKVFDGYYRKSEDPPNLIQERGLKLSLVKDIITAHGGRVWAESWPRQGSAFHFTLLIEK
jgi:signal transduction histidine kinase/FixJ family two-component response regulator